MPVRLVAGAGLGAGEVDVRPGVVQRLRRVEVLEICWHEGREERRVVPKPDSIEKFPLEKQCENSL